MVIFVFPLFLLGTVTPSLVKFTISDIGESGSVAGKLGACNTIGSILGTFLPTFVTIPSVGTSVTFLIFSGILLVTSFIIVIVASLTAPAPDYEHLNGLNFSCLSPEYKKANRESWNWIDVVASIFVVGCVLAAYAYFWTWLN